MKKLLLFILILFSVDCFAQRFFDESFNHHKKYIILTNPTVRNLKTIQFLVNENLLDVKLRKSKFVGVYYTGQKYNFLQTKAYIEENGLKNFFLQEISGDLNVDNLFEKNDCTAALQKVFANSVGVFFFGGPDIPPAVYDEENSRSIVTDPGRHFFETTFLFHLLGGFDNEKFEAFLNQKPNYLVTGFCLGMQTMNVATGGTLIQDIPSELYKAQTPKEALNIGRSNLHHNYWRDITRDSLMMSCNLHTITFTENPFFGKIVQVSKKSSPRVYSNHHQAVENLGKGLEVTAFSPDGKVIEGLAHSKYPNVFAVQFHPEVPGLYEDLDRVKFHPDDTPMSYNDILGKKNVKFHQKYWAHISDVLRHAKNKKIKAVK